MFAGNDFCDCPKNGAWLTKTGARRGFKKLKAKLEKKGRPAPVRIYQCDAGIWHATSREEWNDDRARNRD